jgi:TPR repeat protein
MTPTGTSAPQHDREPSHATIMLANVGFAAVAIIAAMAGFLIHEWRMPGEPTTPHAQLERAEKAFQGGDNQDALMTFSKLASENNPVAEYWLGHMTEFGLGVPRDPAKAMKLYQKAAAQGVVAAQSRLGEAYLHGDLVLPDFARARSFLEDAAYHGDARAAMLLGQMYRQGLGVPADAKEGYAWSEVATVEGSPFAQRERAASLRELKAGEQQAAVARAHDILAAVKHATAAPNPTSGTQTAQTVPGAD